MTPQTFEQWLDCIVNQCEIELTKDFAKRRLAVYRNPDHSETRIFIQLYGTNHLKNIIHWFSIYEQ